jgi:4-alpha-glucanotransferase
MRKNRDGLAGKRSKFAMAFHAFQPVFNFEGEVEKAFEKAYRPFLETMEKFPSVKGTFHFSGNMLEWLERKKPEYISLMKTMSERGQIEIMGGGFFEPVIPTIPREDALGQIRMMTRAVERIFGVKPLGAWTTERVWHRSLADIYREEGMEYTILDDNHLLSSFGSEQTAFGPCVTYGDRSSIKVFPASARLRYLIPFRAPARIIGYMKQVAGDKDIDNPCFFFADDLEKFGAWPRTYDHVHKKKWLEKFFRAVTKEKEWLETLTYSEIAQFGVTHDVGVLQPASYCEMDEWSGGDFANFMKKYPESGRMHSRMLDVSEKISCKNIQNEQLNSRKNPRGAQTELFKAQTNCPYWHGTFGGVYLPHLRAGIYSHIIRAEKILEASDRAEGSPVFCAEKTRDKDTGESILGNRYLKVYIDSSKGAEIGEIDLKEREVNLVNSFSRRREKYHKKLQKGHSSVIRKARNVAIRDDTREIDVHEILGISEKGLNKVLAYDDYRRACFITRLEQGSCKWEKFAGGSGSKRNFFGGKYFSETSVRKDLITRRFKASGAFLTSSGEKTAKVDVVKEVTLGTSSSIMVTQAVRSEMGVAGGVSFGMEFNFLLWDASIIKGPRVFVSDMIELTDMYSGLEVKLFMDKPRKMFTYPVYTINETERGLGKTFQGVCAVVGDKFSSIRTEEEKICAAIYIK